LAAIAIVTVALPTPELGFGVPIQSALVRDVHEHPGVAVRATETSACVAGASAVDGEMVYSQGDGAWLTSTVWSETAMWPDR
jgi:hypothetical protein